MVELVLLGGGGHCKSVIELIRSIDHFLIHGILDPSFNPDHHQAVMGVPIIGNDNDITMHCKLGRQFVITVGQIKNAAIRQKLYEQVIASGGQLPVLIAPTAHVSEKSELKDGTIVLHHALVNCDSMIGKACIINSGSIIEHECHVGDFCHLAPRTTISGAVLIGNNSFVGAGTVVTQGVKLGKNVLVGAGALVLKNVPDNQIWIGNPASPMKLKS
jgi:sugar O-acyltransferase (sialic acid O-acetyltransferase NeuD family)